MVKGLVVKLVGYSRIDDEAREIWRGREGLCLSKCLCSGFRFVNRHPIVFATVLFVSNVLEARYVSFQFLGSDFLE